MFADRLRKSFLQAAIQGQLTEQLPTDGDARDLLKKIRAEKARLVADKKIKAEKTLSPVSDDEIPFNLPDNWCWCRLGEVCILMQYGTSKKSQPQGKIPVLRMGNLQNGKIDYSGLVYTSNEDDIKAYSLDFNDILFNRTNSVDLVGKTSIYKEERKAIFAGYLVRLKTVSINNDFLNMVMQSPYYKDFCYSVMGRGVSQANISAEKLKIFLLPLPPLAEQERIVEKLDALLSEVDEVAKDERELIELEKNFPRRMKNSLLQVAITGKLTKQLPTDGDAQDLLQKIHAEKAKLIADKKIKAEKPLPPISEDEKPFDLPDNWCWCRLGDIALKIHYGFTASASSIGNVKLLRITDIQNDRVNWATVPRCTVTDSQRKDYLLKDGDIVIARTGGTIGKTLVIENLPEETVFASYLIRVMFNENISSKYIKIFAGSPLYWRQIIDKSQGTGQPNVNGKSLSNLIVPLPPLAEQERIVERLDELLPLC